MASSLLALRRLLSSSVVPHSLRSVRPAAVSRLFNTNAVRSYEDDDDKNHRSSRPVSRSGGDFFSDICDPFTPTRSLNEMLNFMDQYVDNPLVSAKHGMGVRRGWDVKEKDDALYLRIDMPGLSREDVKLTLEQNTLVIRGQGKTEKEGDIFGDERRFTSRIGLPGKIYKMDKIKAEMKNGVLKVVVPRIKEEERNNVRHIQVGSRVYEFSFADGWLQTWSDQGVDVAGFTAIQIRWTGADQMMMRQLASVGKGHALTAHDDVSWGLRRMNLLQASTSSTLVPPGAGGRIGHLHPRTVS